jgi:hypothetical protein
LAPVRSHRFCGEDFDLAREDRGFTRFTRRQLIERGVRGGVALAGLAALAPGCGPKPHPTPHDQAGRWELLPNQLDLVPIHAAVLKTGQVLFWSPDLTRNPDHSPGSPAAWPYINDMERVKMALFDPNEGLSRSLAMGHPRNLFCAGQCALPDGRILVAGGHAFPGFGHGADHDMHLFDPVGRTWARTQDMPLARWYPTCTTLETGDALIVSGFYNGVPPNPTTWPFGALINPTYDLFGETTLRATQGLWMAQQGEQTLYPFVKLLPGGTLLVHNGTRTTLFVPDGNATATLGRTRSNLEYANVATKNLRTYPAQGACVLLPLDYQTAKARVLVAGGGGELDTRVVHDTEATSTAEVFDFDIKRPGGQRQDGWRAVQSMKHRRFMSDGVLLPDETVLVLGGSSMGKADDNNDPVLEPELFDSQAERWSPVASQSVPRRYHAVSVLLPDGRVLSAGSSGNWPHAPWPLDDRHPPVIPEYRVEIYSPGYLFRGERPVIDSAPEAVKYDHDFEFRLKKSMQLKSVAFLRPCSVTHTNDMDQRHLRLAIVQRHDRRVTVHTPPDGTWAPPGWYMLFALNEDGVPSVARFVQLA